MMCSVSGVRGDGWSGLVRTSFWKTLIRRRG